MSEQRVYLDTSAVAKRYAEEKDSDIMDKIYADAEMKKSKLCFSLWNIGETVGVFDKYRKSIDPKERTRIFLDETIRLIGNGALEIIEVSSDLLSHAIKIVLKHHIYIADAVQIASASEFKAEMFVTADESLAKTAEKEGFKVTKLSP
ncbi:MAG: type II toxin-antitoxin system VapC family toxin [Candidatus Micrarchaeales archaeon]|nr:type II toxin-antitoxin system VapC family toxin [Candidatus Micrarchaeales archaeon]